LTPEQRARTIFSVDDPEWHSAQRELAFGLLRTSLSAQGLKLTGDIMRLNETLAELTNDHEFLDE